MASLFAGTAIDIHKMQKRLRQTAAELHLPFGLRENTFNSRLAQELEKWAECEKKGDVYRYAVFRSYFALGHNIAKKEILMEIVQSIGLPTAQAEQVLTTRHFANAVDDDWAQSRKRGITAVPTFVLGKDVVVGAQPLPVLERLLNSHGVERRKSNPNS